MYNAKTLPQNFESIHWQYVVMVPAIQINIWRVMGRYLLAPFYSDQLPLQ